jgi:hypothetical protein
MEEKAAERAEFYAGLSVLAWPGGKPPAHLLAAAVASLVERIVKRLQGNRSAEVDREVSCLPWDLLTPRQRAALEREGVLPPGHTPAPAAEGASPPTALALAEERIAQLEAQLRAQAEADAAARAAKAERERARRAAAASEG